MKCARASLKARVRLICCHDMVLSNCAHGCKSGGCAGRCLSNVAIGIALLTLHVVLLDEPIVGSVYVCIIQSQSCGKSVYLSMFFLISATCIAPLLLVALMTSATSSECPIVFLLFMMRTIAA